MDIFSITDIDGFAETIRNGAAESITENYTENLNEFITIEQIKKMIYEMSLGVDEDGFYMINEDVFDNLFDSIRSAIYQSGLAKLAAQGIIECAWDEDSNEMIFWADPDTSIENNLNNNESSNS